MKKVSVLLVLLLCAALLPAAAEADMASPLRVLALIGPTGMGMAPMIAQKDARYAFTLASAPDELTGSIISGNFDIAAIPTNLAALLYQKTQGQVQILAVNTLGVLYILERGNTVHQAGDLAGRTIVTSGQGSVPEYALNYILAAGGLSDTRIDYKAEHNEVSALAAAGKADLVMLPQPMATALLMKDPSVRVALDVTALFAQAAGQQGRPQAVLSMGCLIVRRGFAQENPAAVADFLSQYSQSVDLVNTDIRQSAIDIVAAGILPDEAIAQKAIPLCNIVYIDGAAMKLQLTPLFEILYDANPASVGGALPDEAFYWSVPEHG